MFAFLCSGCKHIPKQSVLFTESDIEAVKNITQQEISQENREEFLSLFQQFAGFSFEKYFFIPEKTEQSNFEILEHRFSLYSGYIISKAKAQELLNVLRKDSQWCGFYDYDDWVDFGMSYHYHRLDVERYNKPIKPSPLI